MNTPKYKKTGVKLVYSGIKNKGMPLIAKKAIEYKNKLYLLFR